MQHRLCTRTHVLVYAACVCVRVCLCVFVGTCFECVFSLKHVSVTALSRRT